MKNRRFLILIFYPLVHGWASQSSTAPVTHTEPVEVDSVIEKPKLKDVSVPVLKKINTPDMTVPSTELSGRSTSNKSSTKPTLGDVLEDPSKEKKEKKGSPGGDILTPEDRKKLLTDVAQEFYEKGESAIQEGRLQEARDFFERALTLAPGHAAAKSRLAATLRALEPPDPEPSANEKNPKEALIAKLSGELDQLIKNKSWDKADRNAKNILAVDPGNEKTKTKLKAIHRQLSLRAADRANAREKAGDFQGAIDAFRVAIGYYKDPTYTERIEELSEKIAEVNSKKSEELYLQALDASQNGNSLKAMELCREALQLNPDNLQAERMLDRLQSKPTP